MQPVRAASDVVGGAPAAAGALSHQASAASASSAASGVSGQGSQGLVELVEALRMSGVLNGGASVLRGLAPPPGGAAPSAGGAGGAGGAPRRGGPAQRANSEPLPPHEARAGGGVSVERRSTQQAAVPVLHASPSAAGAWPARLGLPVAPYDRRRSVDEVLGMGKRRQCAGVHGGAGRLAVPGVLRQPALLPLVGRRWGCVCVYVR